MDIKEFIDSNKWSFIEEAKTVPNKMRKEVIFQIALNFDPYFWAILPALNINLHSNTFEFEWLCFAIYIDKQ